MYYRDGNHGTVKSLLSWLLAPGLVPHTSHSIHYCPMTVLVGSPLTQNQPIIDDVECLALAKMLPTLWIYLVTAKVNVGPCVRDGICLGGAEMEEV